MPVVAQHVSLSLADATLHIAEPASPIRSILMPPVPLGREQTFRKPVPLLLSGYVYTISHLRGKDFHPHTRNFRC